MCEKLNFEKVQLAKILIKKKKERYITKSPFFQTCHLRDCSFIPYQQVFLWGQMSTSQGLLHCAANCTAALCDHRLPSVYARLKFLCHQHKNSSPSPPKIFSLLQGLCNSTLKYFSPHLL